MADRAEEVVAGPPFSRCRPPHEVRATTEQDDGPPIAIGRGSESPFHSPAPCRSGKEARGRSDDPMRSAATQPPGLFSTCRMGFHAASKHFRRKVRSGEVFIRDIHHPNGAAHGRKLFGLRDLLVTEEFGPCTVRRIGEVLDGPFSDVVPPCRGLGGRFDKERQSGIGVAVADHVAGEKASDRARSKTF